MHHRARMNKCGIEMMSGGTFGVAEMMATVIRPLPEHKESKGAVTAIPTGLLEAR